MNTTPYFAKTNLPTITIKPGLTTRPRNSTFRSLVRIFASLVALIALWTGTAQASDPIGVYALVDKVVLEPNASAPERIQIWGAFAFAEGTGNKYKSVERGYLFYKLVPEKANLCRNEWSDLKSVAGTRQIVCFASRYQETGTLRKLNTKPENPDPYPIAMGLRKVKSESDYGPIKALIELRDSQKAKEKPAASKKD